MYEIPSSIKQILEAIEESGFDNSNCKYILYEGGDVNWRESMCCSTTYLRSRQSS